MKNTDVCPHCGAEELISFPYEGICRNGAQKWKCGTPFVRCASGEIKEVTFRAELCRSRADVQDLTRQVAELKENAARIGVNRYEQLNKAQTEVRVLREFLHQAIANKGFTIEEIKKALNTNKQ